MPFPAMTFSIISDISLREMYNNSLRDPSPRHSASELEWETSRICSTRPNRNIDLTLHADCQYLTFKVEYGTEHSSLNPTVLVAMATAMPAKRGFTRPLHDNSACMQDRLRPYVAVENG